MMQASGYWLSQSVRVAWYLSQYLASARLQGRRQAKRPTSAPPPRANLPTMRDLLIDLAGALHRDRANIAAGVYKMPHDAVPDLRRWIGDAALYFGDLPSVNDRRARGSFSEIGEEYERLPLYYRRNFHYQTDGYLSARSAALYQPVDEVGVF